MIIIFIVSIVVVYADNLKHLEESLCFSCGSTVWSSIDFACEGNILIFFALLFSAQGSSLGIPYQHIANESGIRICQSISIDAALFSNLLKF